MGPPLLLAPVIAVLAFALANGGWQATWLVTIAATGAAMMVGWPLLFWAYDNGRTSLASFAVIGAIAGAAPIAGALVSGIVGQYIMSTDIEYVRTVLSYGASIPTYGVIYWSDFWRFLATGMVAGVLWGIASRTIAKALTSPLPSTGRAGPA